MADAATTADAVRTDAGTDHSFLWRRLHSLSGVLPLGGFLCYHIFENMSALRGPERVQRDGQPREHACCPATYFFGRGAGGASSSRCSSTRSTASTSPRTGQPNVGRYAYGSNWAYWAQRITGLRRASSTSWSTWACSASGSPCWAITWRRTPVLPKGSWTWSPTRTSPRTWATRTTLAQHIGSGRQSHLRALPGRHALHDLPLHQRAQRVLPGRGASRWGAWRSGGCGPRLGAVRGPLARRR